MARYDLERHEATYGAAARFRLAEARLRLIWKHEIHPYLEDDFFDEPDRLADVELRTPIEAARGTGDAASDQAAPPAGEEALAASSKSVRT